MSDTKPMTAEEFAEYRSGEHSWGGSPSEDMRRRLCATIEERDRQIEAMRSRDAQLVQKINEFQAGRTRHATLVAKLKAALEAAERT